MILKQSLFFKDTSGQVLSTNPVFRRGTLTFSLKVRLEIIFLSSEKELFYFILSGDQFVVAGKVETDDDGKLKRELSMKVSAHIKGGRHQKTVLICQPRRL